MSLRRPSPFKIQQGASSMRTLLASAAILLLGGEVAAAQAVDQQVVGVQTADATISSIKADALTAGATAGGNLLAATTASFTDAFSQTDTGLAGGAPCPGCAPPTSGPTAGVSINAASLDQLNASSTAVANTATIAVPADNIASGSQIAGRQPTSFGGQGSAASIELGAGDALGVGENVTGTTTVIALSGGNQVTYASTAGVAAGGLLQTNDGANAAAVTLNAATFGGAVTGTGTAVGNVVTSVSSGSGTSALSLSQTDTGSETSTFALTNASLGAAGNSLTVNAVGNLATFGAVVLPPGGSGEAQILQSNVGGGQAATLTIGNASINGTFTANAIGNGLTVAGGPFAALQDNQVQQTATINTIAPVAVANLATTFNATAIGNQLFAANAPDPVGGHSQINNAAQTAIVNLSGVTSFYPNTITVNATAIGNYASLTGVNPDGTTFTQVSNGPQTATVTLSPVTMSGGLTINTTAVANLTVYHK